MTAMTIAVMVVVLVAISAVSFWWAMRPLTKVRRAMAKLPRRRASELVAGEYCVLVGTAASETAVRAPSGRPCVVYATRMHSRDDNSSAVFDAAGSAMDFLVVDGGARIRVSPGGHFLPELRPTASVNVVPKTDHGHAGFGAGIIERNLATAQIDKRAAEGIIAPDQRVAVAGLVVKDADGTLRLVGEPGKPVMITDRGLALSD